MELHEIIDKHSDRLAQKKNVQGVAIGQKWVDGKNTGEEAIIVLVSEKEPLESLSPEDIIEKEIEGIQTDVVGRSGTFRKLAYNYKMRPARPGISCGHPSITAGTLGGLFLDKDDEVVVLSNNHVLANENNAYRIGEDGYAGHAMLQPGPYDGGRHPWHRIGSLKDFVALRKGADNYEDSAIGLLQNSRYFSIDNINPDIITIGRINDFNLTPAVDMPVKKTGRTSGYKTGKIIGINATIYVGYDMGTLKFVDQILTTDMSLGGDSGSLVLDNDNNIVGLLFAGSSQFTVVNKISYPKNTYGLKIYRTPGVNSARTVTITEDASPLAIGDLNISDGASTATIITAARNRALQNKSNIQITEVTDLTYDPGS